MVAPHRYYLYLSISSLVASLSLPSVRPLLVLANNLQLTTMNPDPSSSPDLNACLQIRMENDVLPIVELI